MWKKHIKKSLYRLIAMLLSWSMAFGEVFAMMEEDHERQSKRVGYVPVVRKKIKDTTLDATDDTAPKIGVVRETKLDGLSLRTQEVLYDDADASTDNSVYYSVPTGFGFGADASTEDQGAEVLYERGEDGYYDVAAGPTDDSAHKFAVHAQPSESKYDTTGFYGIGDVSGGGETRIPGQVEDRATNVQGAWNPLDYAIGEDIGDWDPETYEGQSQLGMSLNPLHKSFKRLPLGQSSTLSSVDPDPLESSSTLQYEVPDPLAPYRQDLMRLEQSKLRASFFERVPPRVGYLMVTGKTVTPAFFPPTDEQTIKRLYGITGFGRGMFDAVKLEAYILLPALGIYQLVQGSPDNFLRVLILGNIRNLDGISDFQGQEVFWLAFVAPFIKGGFDAYFRVKLSVNPSQSIKDDLDSLKKKDDLDAVEGRPPTLVNDLWKELFSPFNNPIQNVRLRLLYDGRLTQDEALRALEKAYSLSKTRRGLVWMSLMKMFRDVANGISSPSIAQSAKLKVRGQAFAYLHQALKDSPPYSFQRFYISWVIGDIGDFKSKRKSAKSIALFSLEIIKSGLTIFILPGVLKAAADLARSYQNFPSPTPGYSGSGASENNSTTPGANGTVISPTPGVNGTTFSPTPGANSTVISPTPGVNGTVITPTPGVNDTVISPTPGVNGTVISPTPGVNGTVVSPTPGVNNTAGPTTFPPTSTVNNTAGPTTFPPTPGVNNTAGPTTFPPTSTVNNTSGPTTFLSSTSTRAPTLPPTLPPSQNVTLQLQAFYTLVENWNTFPQEDPRTYVLPRIGRLSAIASQAVVMDLSGKALYANETVSFFMGLAAVQPNMTTPVVNLGGSIIPDSPSLRAVLGVIPLGTETLILDIDTAISQPNPPGGYDFTLLSRLGGSLKYLSLVGWNIGNFTSLTQVLPALRNLVSIDLTQTGLGGNPQTSSVIRALFTLLPNLTSVGLGYNNLGSNSSDVQTLADCLNNTRAPIQNLNVGNNGIGSDAASTFNLLRSFSRLSRIQNLNLKSNPIGLQPLAGASYALTLAGALQNVSSTLESIDFHGMYISNSSTADLATLAAVISNLNLTQFFGAFPARDAAPFPDAFLDPVRMRFSYLNATETDVNALLRNADVINFFTSLSPGTQELDFSSKIGMNVLQAVAAGIVNSSSTITSVNLYRNNAFAPTTASIFAPTQFAPILAPAIRNISSRLKVFNISSTETFLAVDQSLWVAAIGPALEVLDLSNNAFAEFQNLTSLGAALNKTSLKTLFFNENALLSYLGTGPLDVIGSTFLALKATLTNVSLSHDYIFGLGGQYAGQGSDLPTFFARLAKLKLRAFDFSYNFGGSTSGADGVNLAGALRNQTFMTDFDASYNNFNTFGTQGADNLTDVVLYLISNGRLVNFNLAGINISAGYRAANQARLLNVTDTSLRQVCGQELFNIITGTNSTSGGNRRRDLSFTKQFKRDSSFKQPPPSDESPYDDIDIETFATSGASRPMPPQPLVFVVSCLEGVIKFFQSIIPNIYAEGAEVILSETWRSELEALKSSWEERLPPLEVILGSNSTLPIFSNGTLPAEFSPEGKHFNSPSFSGSNATASVFFNASYYTREQSSVFSSSLVNAKVAQQQSCSYEILKIHLFPSPEIVRTCLSRSPTYSFLSDDQEAAKFSQGYLRLGENAIISTLFILNIIHQFIDSGNPTPDIMRDYYETYLPRDSGIQTDFKRRFKEMKHRLWALKYSKSSGQFVGTYEDQLEGLEQDFTKLFSNEEGIGKGRLKSLQKNVDDLEDFFMETNYLEYPNLLKSQRDALRLKHRIENLAETFGELRGQMDKGLFNFHKWHIEDLRESLEVFEDDFDVRKEEQTFLDLMAYMDKFAQSLRKNHKIEISFPVNLPEYQELSKFEKDALQLKHRVETLEKALGRLKDQKSRNFIRSCQLYFHLGHMKKLTKRVETFENVFDGRKEEQRFSDLMADMDAFAQYLHDDYQVEIPSPVNLRYEYESKYRKKLEKQKRKKENEENLQGHYLRELFG